MKLSFIYLVIFITFIACDDQGPGQQDSPDKVMMVLKWPGCDTLEYEPGIDPIPFKDENRLQIMWYSHPQGNQLKEFKIYRSTEPDGSRRYSQVASVPVNNANAQDTVYIDADLELDQRYSYFVTAVGDNGRESAQSDTVWYEFMEKASLLNPKNSVQLDSLPITFNWEYSGSSGINPNEYILRIEQYWDETYHPLVFVKIVQAGYAGIDEAVIDGEWTRQNIKGIPYRWRIDCIGPEELNIGSESDWELFYLNTN